MTATASRSSELKIIAQHTGSVLAGQLAVMAFGIADTVIAGRYSDTALAALSVGSALYISVYVGLIGIVQALLPIWSEMLGAGQRHAVGASVRQSLYLSLIITVAGMAALAFPAPLLAWAEVPNTLLAEVSGYLTVLAFAFAPALLFRIYGAFNQSLGKPLMVTSLQVLALTVKIPLSIWLVAGGGGIEPMGAVGCAWATLIVNYFYWPSRYCCCGHNRFTRPLRCGSAWNARTGARSKAFSVWACRAAWPIWWKLPRSR